MNKKYFILAIIAVVIVSALALKIFERVPKYGVVVINNKEWRVEIANTTVKRIQGLSGRENFGDISGMLFDFSKFGKHGIWMKDMNFPIDIIWLNNGKIVDISPNASPELDTSFIFYPREDANYVLEFPANFAESNNLEIGSVIEIKY
jgi:hypothetical protein